LDGALSQTPLWELTALPKPLAGFRGLLLRREGRYGKGRRREKREKRREEGEGRE